MSDPTPQPIVEPYPAPELIGAGSYEEERAALERTWRRPPGLYGWITSTDHKEIGLRFIKTAFVFFALAGVLAVLMRIQLSRPENTFLGPDLYNQIFTTHGTAMMFLFAVPVMEGMALYLVPLMIGTRNVAFPRLMNFGYWVFVFAGCLLYAGLLLDIGPDMGWFAYAPLSGPEYTPGKRFDIWSQVVTLVEVSSLVGAVEVITTTFKQRAPGMSLSRIPLFVWAMVITSFMIIFAMPSVMTCSTMMSMDRLTNVHTQFYNRAEGGDPLLWQHLFWFFAHPEVYIIFIPATGFISAILPTFCRRPMFGYTPLILSLIATAFIGFGVWVHHMFATPLPRLGQGLFTASSMMIVIPNGLQIFCWTATICTGKLRFDTPMLFMLGFFGNFLIGGLTGVMLASVTIDLQLHDTFFVVAHLHYVLIGGALFPLFGAIYYWFPKWTGKLMNERMGFWNFVLLFVGFNLTFFPMHMLGLRGMTRRVYTYLHETGWGSLNMLATVGAGVMAAGIVLFLVNVWWSRRYGAISGDNPWGADTLEWATASPPPPGNFVRYPTVGSLSPLWLDPPTQPTVIGISSNHREVLLTTTHDAIPDSRYHMGHETIWSFWLAQTVGWMVVGFIFHPVWIPIGFVLGTAIVFAWFWPTTEPAPIYHSKAQEHYFEKHTGVGGAVEARV